MLGKKEPAEWLGPEQHLYGKDDFPDATADM